MRGQHCYPPLIELEGRKTSRMIVLVALETCYVMFVALVFIGFAQIVVRKCQV
jgi:hypothetical protein